MRGVIPVELPAPAKAKLAALQVARMASEDGARSCQQRINGRPDEGLLEKLTAERDKHSERLRAISLLVSRINEWTMQLRPGTVLESAPAIAAELKDGETLVEALAGVRSEIATLQQERGRVAAAPLPLEDQVRSAEAFVAKLALPAKPTVAVMRDDQLRVGFRDSVVGGTEDVLALLCWLAPQLVSDALARELKAAPARIGTMTSGERARREKEISVQLEKLERHEEALIERAASEGIELPRRPDIVNPGVVLGVVIKPKAAPPRVA
jgi:hypothetical protein